MEGRAEGGCGYMARGQCGPRAGRAKEGREKTEGGWAHGGPVLSGNLKWLRKHLEKDRVKDGTLGRNPGLLGSGDNPTLCQVFWVVPW